MFKLESIARIIRPTTKKDQESARTGLLSKDNVPEGVTRRTLINLVDPQDQGITRASYENGEEDTFIGLDIYPDKVVVTYAGKERTITENGFFPLEDGYWVNIDLIRFNENRV